MNFDIIKQQTGQFLSRNGATVLTAGGVIGTVTTAVLAARASFKASELLLDQKDAWNDAAAKYALEHDGIGAIEPLKQTDKLKAIWPVYVPPVFIGTLTVTSIVGANMVSARKAAALAAVYALQDERFLEYKAKVSEYLTGPKQQKVLDDLAQDQVTGVSPGRDVIIIAEGDVLCFDRLSGRYFQSSVEKIRRAELDIREELYNHNSASLSEFYIKVGLAATSYSEEVGWNLDNPIEISFSTTRTVDDRPCIAIDFGVTPKPEYHRNY